MDIIKSIASIPLFEGLPRKYHEDLALIAVTRLFKRGQTIFSEGDEGTGFHVILSGRVKIFKLSADGKEQILHIFGPGEPIGEVSVFTGQRFPANAKALEECRTSFFPRAAFVELIKQNPYLAMNMLAILSRRLRKFTQLVEDLSLKEVPGRLAAYLLYLRERQEGSNDLRLDIAKGQLASLLGTIPETLSRMLAKMTKLGLIQIHGAHIKIVDPEGLQDLAGGEKRLPA